MYPEPKLSEDIQKNEGYLTLVRRATGVLWETVGDVPGPVEVAWDVVKDYRGTDELRLTLRDEHGLAVALFKPSELEAEYRLPLRFYPVWGRFLRERTRDLLREFNQMIGARDSA